MAPDLTERSASVLSAVAAGQAPPVVMHDLTPPGVPRIDRLVIGPAGVFVLENKRPSRRERSSQSHRLRDQLRWVRGALDAGGLNALPAEALVWTVDLDAAIAHTQSDTRFGPGTIRGATRAIEAATNGVPAFVADVATRESARGALRARQPQPRAAANPR